MKQRSLHTFNITAKQIGTLPTYWSAISLGNDRAPECLGGFPSPG